MRTERRGSCWSPAPTATPSPRPVCPSSKYRATPLVLKPNAFRRWAVAWSTTSISRIASCPPRTSSANWGAGSPRSWPGLDGERLLGAAVALGISRGGADPLTTRMTSMAKIKTSEVAKRIALEGMQMIGGYGCDRIRRHHQRVIGFALATSTCPSRRPRHGVRLVSGRSDRRNIHGCSSIHYRVAGLMPVPNWSVKARVSTVIGG